MTFYVFAGHFFFTITFVAGDSEKITVYLSVFQDRAPLGTGEWNGSASGGAAAQSARAEHQPASVHQEHGHKGCSQAQDGLAFPQTGKCHSTGTA